MEKHTAIITAGTSIMTHTNNVLSDVTHQLKTTPANKRYHVLKKYLDDHPEITLESQISAEIQITNSLIKSRKLAENATIILMHSATEDGRLAVETVDLTLRILKDSLGKVELIEVENLNMKSGDARQVQIGMNSFIDNLIDIFERFESNKESIIFSPIGGFKSMTMLSHLVASTYQIESWYQFENATFPINIPLIPVMLDDFIFETEEVKLALKQFYLLNHFDFNEIALLSDLPEYFDQLSNKYPTIFYRLEAEDGALISISPLIKKRLLEIQDNFLPTFYFSKTNSIDEKDKSEIYKKFITAWPTAIGSEDYKYTFEHEYDLKLGSKDNQWHVFRAKRGDSLRPIYYLDKDSGDIYFKEVLKHDEYEQLLKSEKSKQTFEDKLKDKAPHKQDYDVFNIKKKGGMIW